MQQGCKHLTANVFVLWQQEPHWEHLGALLGQLQEAQKMRTSQKSVWHLLWLMAEWGCWL